MKRKLKLILILLGFVNAIFLTYKHLTSAKGCIVGQGCDVVTTSSYSMFLGFPVALYGVVFFTVLMFVFLQDKSQSQVWILLEKLGFTPRVGPRKCRFNIQN